MSFRDAALSLSIPLVSFPTVLAVGTFFAIPGHVGWADGAHSWLQLEELILAHTFITIEVAVVWACWNWNFHFLALATFFASAVATLAHTIFSIPYFIIIAVRHINTISLYSCISSIAFT